MTKTTPSVSVILPTYNRATLLPRAIYSVLNQSYHDLELIVVDDCSTDGTEDELSKIKDARLRVIRQSINSGPSAARNVGIRASLGRYVAFQDSDDEWLPEKLRKQVEMLEQHDELGNCPAACYSRFIILRYNKKTIVPSGPSNLLSGRIYERLLYGNTMGTPSTIFRKEILDIVGSFDESITNREDWDLALRIARDYPIAFLDEATLVSYDSPRSVNKLVSPESEVKILHKHYDSYKAFPETMARITWSIGSEYAMLKQRGNALHYMKISLERSPTTSKRLLFTALRCGINLHLVLLHARNILRP
jgi:glycosyltransferase involved in cell wall biosynthesis